MSKCILCGRELVPPPWWKFWADRSPYCAKTGAVGEACWQTLNARLGVEHPGPKPRAKGE